MYPIPFLKGPSSIRRILEQFQGRRGAFSPFQGRSTSDRRCDILGFVPAGSVSSSSTYQPFREEATCEGCFARQRISSVIFLDSFTPTCPGQYTHRSFRRWMSTIDTFQFGLPILLLTLCSKKQTNNKQQQQQQQTLCSKLIGSVRMIECVVQLSPLETVQRRACVVTSTFSVKLEVETGLGDSAKLVC